MLQIGNTVSKNCQGVARRSLLEAGTLGALGLSLPQVLAAGAASAAPRNARARSVVLLWLYGGPSHHDLWDPKPAAPLEIRGVFRPIRTAAPDITLTELLPQLAGEARHFSLVRGMHHENSDHNVGGTIALTGVPAGGKLGGGAPVPGTRRPTLGSLVARLAGFQPGKLPPFTCVGKPTRVSGGASGQDAAGLGALYEPFRVEYYPETGVQLPPEFGQLSGVTSARLQDRRRLLSELDQFARRASDAAEVARVSEFHQQALTMITSPRARAAFDLDAEPSALRDRYGRTRFGQSCLMARRLVEAGVPFIQVNWSDHGEDQQTSGGDGGWDHHYRLFEFIQDGGYAWTLDQGVSAFIGDLRGRGLLESTLVIVMGEFGRTPKINSVGGRDHWSDVYTVLLAGGGVQGGRVVGASDEQGAYPASHPYHPTSLHATVLEALGLDRLSLIPLGAAVDAPPIHELF
jgi:hypothetical protein